MPQTYDGKTYYSQADIARLAGVSPCCICLRAKRRRIRPAKVVAQTFQYDERQMQALTEAPSRGRRPKRTR